MHEQILKPAERNSTDNKELNYKEAKMEANMLRTIVSKTLDHEPTADDYDKALQIVEEIRSLAAKEPVFDKAFFKLLQRGNKYFQIAVDCLVWPLTLGRKGFNQNDSHYHMFDDATARLEQLKKEANELENGQK